MEVINHFHDKDGKNIEKIIYKDIDEIGALWGSFQMKSKKKGETEINAIPLKGVFKIELHHGI